jgi:hypothetical protein
MWARHGSILLTCARLQLRKRRDALVARIGMLSWGSRGRRFKSDRSDGFSNASRPTGDFRTGVVAIAALTDALDRSLVSSLTIWGYAGNEAFEGVHGQQPGRLPVRGPVPAFAVILQAS